MKHTKGIWFPVDIAGFWTLRDAPFYDSNDLLNEDDCAKARANAKLAAAAPELLEALRELRGMDAKITDQETKELFQRVVYPIIEKTEGL